jgi:hypothetical protein
MGENVMEVPTTFEITLYMQFSDIAPPQERDQVIMDIIFSQSLDPLEIARINQCQVYLQALFLSDITTADRRYLEHFIFNPGRITK